MALKLTGAAIAGLLIISTYSLFALAFLHLYANKCGSICLHDFEAESLFGFFFFFSNCFDIKCSCMGYDESFSELRVGGI